MTRPADMFPYPHELLQHTLACFVTLEKKPEYEVNKLFWHFPHHDPIIGTSKCYVSFAGSVFAFMQGVDHTRRMASSMLDCEYERRKVVAVDCFSKGLVKKDADSSLVTCLSGTIGKSPNTRKTPKRSSRLSNNFHTTLSITRARPLLHGRTCLHQANICESS